MVMDAGVRVWMGRHNEEVRGGARRDVVAGYASPSFSLQVN